MKREIQYFKSYVLSMALIISLCLAAVFFAGALRTRYLVFDEILNRSRAYFKSIVITRKWNAHYGGVYVEKKEGVQSNPYIENPDIRTIDGRVYTIRNPALMTREISQYAEKEGLFQFHMSSLRPLNPENSPDAFERMALDQFDKGKQEFSGREQRSGRTHFRYMAPLFVEEACLPCHARQGYRAGEVRGGISVTFDIHDIEKEVRRNFYAITFLAIFTTAGLVGLVYLFTSKFYRQLNEAREKMEVLAITDELTGLYNRRHLLARFEEEFRRAKRLNNQLGFIIIDLDHFKKVNDRFGHLAGDEVLKALAASVKESIRSYDILGRLGGEEFLVILPDTGFEETRRFAERLRTRVKHRFDRESVLPEKVPVTISLGITVIHPDDESIGDILRRADAGLYRAKTGGRDRVGSVRS